MVSQNDGKETSANTFFIAPSIHEQAILAGDSYTHHTSIPETIAQNLSAECVLGVDEAGRGPVLGQLPESSPYTALTNQIIRSYGLWFTISTCDNASISPC